jgi:TonB family protein
VTAMRKVLFCQLLIFLCVPTFGQNVGCTPTLHYMGVFRKPTATEHSHIPKNAVVRADIALSAEEKLLIYETGKEEPKAEFKIVSGEKELLSVALTKLPELKQDPILAAGLRPTWFAQLCQADGQKMVVVASGSGATGEGQFFLVFVGAVGQYRSFQLPIAIKGRVELSAKQPDTFKLWSIVDSERMGVALPHYKISIYKLDDTGFHRLETNKTKRGYDPGEFVNHPIVLENGRARNSAHVVTREQIPAVPLQRTVKVSEVVANDHLLKKIEPQYPPMAKIAGLQGMVVLKATISPKGKVTNVVLVNGHPLLVPEAILAVRQWEYQPFTVDGQAVTAETTIAIPFSLSVANKG